MNIKDEEVVMFTPTFLALKNGMEVVKLDRGVRLADKYYIFGPDTLSL